MTDQEFLLAFEQQRLHAFPHAAHIRMAWLYLSQYGWDEGIARIRDGIQRFATAHNATQKYHETITLFWSRLVHYAISQSTATNFEQFINSYPHLLDSTLHTRHYSREVIQSDAARHGWVEPDLIQMPA
jgi:hypothetical protein